MDPVAAQLERQRETTLINSVYNPSPDTTKICTKCKYCPLPDAGDNYRVLLCTHPLSIDVITGASLSAMVMRGVVALCGPKAVLYVAA
ncbi:MAG: hypothetical protein HRJ53_24545 [Acidobacteria bacterium Pan2503]|uniref:Uncharacterized protein n=1 Tax=Candidatus Acidiferrum panamense TaxID=2741543 RepID=A0A7V8NVG9_9BACT|nr:hypothetical protein [Candidatus Acidoferrum panamensis]